MDEMNVMLLSVAQQKLYVDVIFAMAALDGFELLGPEDSDNWPIMAAKRIGKYTIELSWMDEDECGPDATKARWEIEVREGGPGPTGGEWRSHVLYVALHATDALRMAKGLVRLYTAATEGTCNAA
jgi:hypothetical protein